jgi:NADH dehydrogenase (ubiquinone) Fe-S protein 1
VDGIAVDVMPNTSVLQACEKAGVNVPRFCYHEALSVAGNCRMCLVEVEKVPKCVASCAFPVMPNMNVYTNTPVVKKAREAVMEFLLANHPLDCPICDQGGECDLQDQAMTHGSDSSRFFEYKRGVEDKNVGPLVKMVMTRCIHCTRCVRFAEEIAGVQDLGMTGRGKTVEIGTYVEKIMSSELSGNVIDLCPVGALTSKPYAMTARPWELRDTESIDVHDAIGSNIVVRSRGTDIMKIEPKRNPMVNEEWLSDKSRFSYDGLVSQRLDTPMIKENGTFVPVTWEVALKKIAEKMGSTSGDKMKAVVGDLADCESIMALKDFMNQAGCENLECRQDGAELVADLRGGYLLNTGLQDSEQTDCVLLVGTNPRHEAPLFNTRLRKSVLHKDIDIGYIGPAVDLTYGIDHLGNGTATLAKLAKGDHPFCEQLAAAEKPMVVLGMSGLRREDAAAVKASVATLAKNIPNLLTDSWNGFNVLHTAAARVGALELGFVPSGESSAAEFVYLLGADDFSEAAVPAGAFVVYQGHHGDAGAVAADVILPGAAYTEKHGTYVNTEGRVQRAKRAKAPIGDAREDWAIVRALSEVCGKPLAYDSLDGVRARMAEVSPTLVTEGVHDCPLTNLALDQATTVKDKMTPSPFARAVDNFYMTNAINRSSVTMAKCTAAKQPSYAFVGAGVTSDDAKTYVTA